MKFLSSMMLLGLTQAQLDVYRWKEFRVGYLMPLDRLLNIGDNVVDDLILEVKCDDNSNMREFIYNNITPDHIGERLCPAPYEDPSALVSISQGQPWDDSCWDNIHTYPTDNYYSDVWLQDNGSLICDKEADVEFKIYRQGISEFNSVSEQYDLRTYQFACIEDDFIEIIFLLGMRDFWEGADMCFDNSPYYDVNNEFAAPDYPFVVDNNCYHSSWYDCHTQGYKVKVHVMDHEAANLADGIAFPLRLPKMYVKVSFDSIYDYFQIFPDDKAKISLYNSEKTDPQSVVISPGDYVEPICEPLRVADEIRCNNLNVYCRDSTDDITLRIVAAGEILMYEVNCGDLVSGGFDYSSKYAQLSSDSAEDYANYEAGLGQVFYYVIEEDQYGLPAGALMTYEYGTFIESQNMICFTGDFFPFGSPSCQLWFGDGNGERWDINTRVHNANEYAIDDSVLELVINQDYPSEILQEVNIYSSGEPLAIDEQLMDAIRGYVNVDYLDEAIPNILTITDLPSCGVLTKQGTTEEDQSFALFWSYTTYEDYSVELGVGAQVNLNTESILFADTEDCDSFYTNFQYIVDAEMPVDGPTATGILRQSEGDSAEKLTATTLGLSAIMSAKLAQLF